jgi:hypothetical protein
VETNFYSKLHDYYFQKEIHPNLFRCLHQDFCRQYAYQGNMTEAKMSMVGSQYGTKYPRIVVVSFDPPQQSEFSKAEDRLSESIAQLHEQEDFNLTRPNPHWAMTQIIVKDILCLFGYPSLINSAVVSESYAGRTIENVSAFFAHVNVAKCSMNNLSRGKASAAVHKTCGEAYLIEELIILEPNVIISQGSNTNFILGELLTGTPIYQKDLPVSKKVKLGSKTTMWMPMYHPSRFTHKIRVTWGSYVVELEKWNPK